MNDIDYFALATALVRHAVADLKADNDRAEQKRKERADYFEEQLNLSDKHPDAEDFS